MPPPRRSSHLVAFGANRVDLATGRGTTARVLPTFIGFHFAKRLFAWNYVRMYRH